MADLGFVKVAAASPKMRVADPSYNASQIEKMIIDADRTEAAIIVFPELCLTGYTSADLFGQKLLIDKTKETLIQILVNCKDTDIVAAIGMPVEISNSLYNCAVLIKSGSILGVVPKTYPANYKEFYEKRWFSSGYFLSNQITEIEFNGMKAPFGNILFKSTKPEFCLGVEICEDLWAVIPPSSYMALHGANIILNLSASNELVAKADYRRQLVSQQSARCMSGYVYTSSGVHESTTDMVFGGESVIAENGAVLEAGPRFSRNGSLIFCDIDIDRLSSERRGNKSYSDNFDYDGGLKTYRIIDIDFLRNNIINEKNFHRKVPSHPFVPDNPTTVNERCEEIFNIQVAGLAKRMEHTGIRNAVIGISGGLDSTLALLVTSKTFELLNIPSKGMCTVTMPGFGTTDQTYKNAVKLMKSLKTTVKEIDIRPACIQHFGDIDHNPDIHDITYENVQARERTQILMDIANKIDGLVIGTGDLSELALGWATYNGDHMSHYAVNSGIPKTLVRFLVRWASDNVVKEEIKLVLHDILDTPITPELLPPDHEGRIVQKTEDVIGPYELHDFFLYYVVRHGMPPRKVLFLANMAFAGKYSGGEISKWLKVFYKRFFSQQFKRSCLPDGPKVGTINLSPRGDWRMPSDAEVNLWISELEW